MSISTNRNTSPHRVLALVAAVSLGLAACGADETIDAGAPVGEPSAETTPATLPDLEPGEEMAPESDRKVTEGFTALTPRTDLVQLQAAEPDEVIVDPNDDTRLLIHFEGAAEPCSGAAVDVVETEADVVVTLQTGLDPNVAAMSCIAQVFDYEIVVQLGAPVGDRVIAITS